MNFYLKKNNAHFSDFFGSQTDVISKFKNITDPIKNRKIEIMVHPDYNSEGILVDKIGNLECDFNFVKSLGL